jgi:hypothetical protein
MQKKVLLIMFVIFLIANINAQPNLINPVDGATNVGLNPTLEWSAVVGATDYQLQVATDNLFNTIVFDQNLGNVTSYSVALAQGTQYYWRVQDDVSNTFSSISSFTTYFVPGGVTLVSPANNSYNNPLTVNFSWDPATNTDDYLFELATDNLFTNIVYSDANVAGTTVSVSGLNNYTQYYWRVTAQNNYASGTPSSATFTTELASPVLVSPGDLSFHNLVNPDLQWNAVTGATSYDLEIAEDNAFTVNLQSFTGVNATNLVVTGLSHFTDYYWRVKAVNAHGESAFSSVFSFKTKLAAPTLVFPANGSNNVTIVPVFDWNSVVGEAPVTYTLQVAKNASFSSGLITITALANDEFEFTPPSYVLENGTTYYFRVSATDSYGVSDYSSTFSFTTVPEIIPVLGWPIGGSGAYNNPQLFSWYLNQYAPGTIYDFELSLNSDLTSPVIVVNNINGTTLSQSLSGLPGNTMLYWRVRSKVSPTVVSHYSAIDSFTIQTPGFVALQPYPSYPTGGTTVYNSSQTLYWYLLAAGAGLTYELEYNTSGTFTGTPTVTGITNLYYALTGLTPGSTYYWKVRSFNGLQYSDWSAAESFNVYGSSTPAEPVPSWPIGGNLVYTVSPTLYWYLNEYAPGLTYDVEYNTSGTFSGTPTVAGVSSQYLTLTGLTPGSTYYWKVRSFNGTNYSNWSATESFEVYSNVTASAPIPSYPVSGTTVYTLEPTLYWYLNGPSAGLTFDIEFNTTGTFTGTPTYTGITNTNYNLPTLTAGETYYYKVRSFDGTNYSAWSNAESFVVIGTGGSLVPVASWPIGGATVYTTSQQLSWYLNGSSLGLTYQVEVSYTGSFTGTPTYTGLTNMNYTLTGLTEGSTVYWRVRSFNGVTPSAWSTTEYFVVYDPNAPLMPLTGSPAGGVVINTNSPLVSWVLPAPNSGLTYELQISDNPFMEGVTVISDLPTPKYEARDLNINTTYYWRVRSKLGENNYSAYSSVASFNTGNGVTGVEENNIAPSNFFMAQNYPNPFNPSTNIKFGIPTSTNVKVAIFNMLGQQIKVLVNGMLNAGNYNLTWDGTNEAGVKVAGGAYIYRITAGNFVDTKKMVLLK